jgi:hypothetical protein
MMFQEELFSFAHDQSVITGAAISGPGLAATSRRGIASETLKAPFSSANATRKQSTNAFGSGGS